MPAYFLRERVRGCKKGKSKAQSGPCSNPLERACEVRVLRSGSVTLSLDKLSVPPCPPLLRFAPRSPQSSPDQMGLGQPLRVYPVRPWLVRGLGLG